MQWAQISPTHRFVCVQQNRNLIETTNKIPRNNAEASVGFETV